MFVSGVVSTIVSLLGVQMGAARVVDEGTADFITYFGSLFAGIAVVLVWAWFKLRAGGVRGEGGDRRWRVERIEPGGVKLRAGRTDRFVLWSEVREVRDVGVEVHLMLATDSVRLDGVTKSSENAKSLRTAFARSQAGGAR